MDSFAKINLSPVTISKRHDEAQALYNARHEEKLGFAQNMKADGEPIEKIVRYTGLSKESIEELEV